MHEIRRHELTLGGLPVRYCSSALAEALDGCFFDPWVWQALVESAYDTAEEGEPKGWLFETSFPTHPEGRVWFERSGETPDRSEDFLIAYFPSER